MASHLIYSSFLDENRSDVQPTVASGVLRVGVKRGFTTATWRAIGGPAHYRRNRKPSSAVDEEFAHADHYVFCSNEAQVIREMNTFIAGIPSLSDK